MFLNKTVSDILKKPNDFILFTDNHGISIETSFSNRRLVLLLPWVPDLRGFRFRSSIRFGPSFFSRIRCSWVRQKEVFLLRARKNLWYLVDPAIKNIDFSYF